MGSIVCITLYDVLTFEEMSFSMSVSGHVSSSGL